MIVGPAVGPKTEGTCEYVFCGREAELRVSAPPTIEPMLVCGLHVSPVLSWGVVLDATVDAPPTIEYLRSRPEHTSWPQHQIRSDPAA